MPAPAGGSAPGYGPPAACAGAVDSWYPRAYRHAVTERMGSSQDPVTGAASAMTIEYVPQTAVETMARIAAGVDPWVAFRDFLEDWTYLPASRPELAAGRPPFTNEEERRWATLLAAAVVALCARDGLIAPGWAREPVFRDRLLRRT
jgi:hypothetical protein